MAKVLFSDLSIARYAQECTLPAKFGRMLDEAGLDASFKGARTAVKMHVGRGTGYSTIPPIFVKILVDRLKQYGAAPYLVDDRVDEAEARGYTERYFGCPIVPSCGVAEKYLHRKEIGFKTFTSANIGGNFHDADAAIVLSHVKGHGACGFGGACKNIAMGCVDGATRGRIHGLESGLAWDETKCTHCEACLGSCNHHANRFDENGKYEVFYHDCTLCQHCVKVCPTGAISPTDSNYEDFQHGMALCTRAALEDFPKDHVFYVNVMLQMTALCDCWGFTTPSVVPDVGIVSSYDLVAVEQASLDRIRVEDFCPNSVPVGFALGTSGHLLERIHGKDPFLQLDHLAALGLGSRTYETVEVR
jgi:uncharacterized protein